MQECDYCTNPAKYYSEYEGCTICGGSECGDSFCFIYLCAECADDSHWKNRIKPISELAEEE